MRKHNYKLLILLIFISLIVIVAIPILIDWCFRTPCLDWVEMRYIDASDVLGYVGACIGSLCALVAVIVAINQFTSEKTPFPIPENIRIFYAFNQKGKFAFLVSSHENSDVASHFVIQNPTENPILKWELILDYAQGKYLEDICNQVGTRSDVFKSQFIPDKQLNLSILNPKSKVVYPIPKNLLGSIKGIIHTVEENNQSVNLLFSSQQNGHKIAEMIISYEDIRGKKYQIIYDVRLRITALVGGVHEANYEVHLNFHVQDQNKGKFSNKIDNATLR